MPRQPGDEESRELIFSATGVFGEFIAEYGGVRNSPQVFFDSIDALEDIAARFRDDELSPLEFVTAIRVEAALYDTEHPRIAAKLRERAYEAVIRNETYWRMCAIRIMSGGSWRNRPHSPS